MTDTPKPDELLHKTPQRLVPFSIPVLVSQRLDDLCGVLNGPDGKLGTIYRKDLVAALAALAPEDLDGLEKLITDYRAMAVNDGLVGKEKDAKVIRLRDVKPGRRTAS